MACVELCFFTPPPPPQINKTSQGRKILSCSCPTRSVKEGNPRKTIELDSPCQLLKLRQMGTQGVHIKGVLPQLVCLPRGAALLHKRCLSAQNRTLFSYQNLFSKIFSSKFSIKSHFFLSGYLLHFICPGCTENWETDVPRRLSPNKVSLGKPLKCTL